MAIEEVRKNKNAKRPNFHKGSLSHSPSQTNGDAKVQINSEIAIPKLQKLAETYFGVSDPHRFLTDLRVALGIPDSQGASKYGVVSIPKEDGSILQASLRVTNHQANANTYIDHDANYKYNLSIVVRRKQRKNTFIPNENVILDEYVYYGTKMQDIENPLTQIVNGIIVFLQSGEYKDTTGVAFKNQSVESKDRVPQNISVDNDGNYVSANACGADYVSENKQYNTNRNMNKKVIRLTEADLHKIVKESVQRIVSEASATPNGYKHRFDPNKRDGDFPLGQPEWTKDPRWQGWNGEDPEWIMKQQEKYPYGGEIEQPVRVSEAQLHQIVKESVEQVMNEGVGDYFGAIRRGWNTPVKSYEFGNTKGALRAMDSIENRALQHQMNTERGIGLQGYNTKFEQDVKNWLRGDTVRINDKMSPKTQQYWRQVKAKADEILNNHGKEKVMGVLGAMRSRF